MVETRKNWVKILKSLGKIVRLGILFYNLLIKELLIKINRVSEIDQDVSNADVNRIRISNIDCYVNT